MQPFLVQFLVKVSDLVGIMDNEFLKGLFAIKASIKSYQLIIAVHVYFCHSVIFHTHSLNRI